MEHSSVSLLTAMVTAVVVFLFTTAWVTAKAARNTLRVTKAAIGPARKTFWSTIGSMLKIAFWAVILLIALVAWLTSDAGSAEEQKPVPGPSVSRR